MKTIEHDVVNELLINKSRFITILKKIDDTSKISKIIEEIKTKYPNATHYCYAYIVDNMKKASDDNEPSGTAGIPILTVLEKEHLTNILAVVVRYYGGVKLGAPGLIRAYTKSITSALFKTKLHVLKEYYLIDIEFDYDHTKKIDYLLKNSKITENKFDALVKYTFLIEKSELKIVGNQLLLNSKSMIKIKNVFL